MRRQAVIRIRVFTGLVLLFALVLVGRLYQVQILNAEEYEAKGEKQYVHTVEDLYDRGTIYFTTRDGERIAAATVYSGYVLAIDPSGVENAEELYQKLQPYLPVDRETFIYRATLPDRTYVEINESLKEEDAKVIESLALPGVRLYKNRWRYYPGGSLSARTVGFVGFSEGEAEAQNGRYGLERYYDETLSHESERLSVNFFAEIFSNVGNLLFDSKEKRTGDVVTTLEPTVSRMLQNKLQEVNDKYESKLTGGVIINPKTGAIYALDAVPTFDPNDRSGAVLEDFKNPLVENIYELGSTIKALTMAAGIDSKAVSPSTTYYDAGYLELSGFTIRNFDGKGRGTVPMQEVLNQSLNTGVAFVANTMGKDKFRQYFINLKLGSETGIDLPGEIHGKIDNLNSPRELEYATASFGQGIALTPIAAVRALSALGNGGKLITPHLVSAIEYEDGTVKEIKFPEGESVWSEETSETISRMLVTVVDDALGGGNVELPRYTVAAKTGTAQIADPVNGGYYEDRFLHSFFGYFPAYDPQFLVFLYTEEPRGVRFASETLTQPFMEITKFLINYYSVPPDR